MPPAPNTAGTPRPLRKFGDPVAFYQKHYPGLTRGQLQQRDPALYHRLRKDGLIDAVPGEARRRFSDPLAVKAAPQ